MRAAERQEASAGWPAGCAAVAAAARLLVNAACRMAESCCKARRLCCRLLAATGLTPLPPFPLPPHQIVLNRGSAGCAQLPPGPPENLRARPGDGEVTLTWDRPRNGELDLTLHQQ